MSCIALNWRSERARRVCRLSAIVGSALILITLAATPTWSQQRPGTEQQVLFGPSPLNAEPGVFAGGTTLPAPKPAKPFDPQAQSDRDANPFAPLRSFPLPNANRPTPQLGRAAPSQDNQPGLLGQKIERFSLGLETETRFKPDELPGGDKTHALTYQRELRVKPFVGLSLTSPIE